MVYGVSLRPLALRHLRLGEKVAEPARDSQWSATSLLNGVREVGARKLIDIGDSVNTFGVN
jgi:hypothetical protein